MKLFNLFRITLYLGVIVWVFAVNFGNAPEPKVNPHSSSYATQAKFVKNSKVVSYYRSNYKFSKDY